MTAGGLIALWLLLLVLVGFSFLIKVRFGRNLLDGSPSDQLVMTCPLVLPLLLPVLLVVNLLQGAVQLSWARAFSLVLGAGSTLYIGALYGFHWRKARYHATLSDDGQRLLNYQRIEPSNADVLNHLAEMSLMRREPERAKCWLRRSIRRQPKRPQSHALLIRLLLDQGEVAAARAALRRMATELPNHRRLETMRKEIETAVASAAPGGKPSRADPRDVEPRQASSSAVRPPHGP